jgi:predicted nucleic acid-binding protein
LARGDDCARTPHGRPAAIAEGLNAGDRHEDQSARGTEPGGASRASFDRSSKKPPPQQQPSEPAGREGFGSGKSASEGRSIPAKRSTKSEPVLVDTNVLLEATDEARTHHREAVRLIERHPALRLSAQVIREYLVVATRPTAANGLGLRVTDTIENVREFRRSMRLLVEEKPVLPTLLGLLRKCLARADAFDAANFVATALAHDMRILVSLNAADFTPVLARIAILSPREAASRSV